MKTYMMNHRDEEFTFGPMYKKYFYLHYEKENKIFLLPEENTQVTERELNLCGRLNKKPNYMTVPATIKELKKV